MVVERNNEPRVIELRAFMGLMKVFAERKWKTPHYFALTHETTGPELLALLDIQQDQVEGIFVNRILWPMVKAVIRPGDRVALVPPGVPGPYRVLLGCRELPKDS
jgi:hypothetical protein